MESEDIRMESKDIEKIKQALDESLHEELCRMIISKPLKSKETSKITVRPVLLHGELFFQETATRGTQVFHENLSAEESKRKIEAYFLQGEFGQMEAECREKKVLLLRNKKGTVTLKRKKLQMQGIGMGDSALAHNRTRNYILPDGEPVDFLVALGVQTADGRVVKAKYDKFRQINRYLEFVQDVLPALEGKDSLRIIDFGCGKSYLTFALYYYLKIKLGFPVEIIGLDLKKDVIAGCNALKDRLGYDGLIFFCGDIKDYDGCERADMVVTLHACDTATDYAIEKAVKWQASVIMTVPCCQHELNRQIKAEKIPELQQALKYGLIKERMAALLTDAYRANCLEQMGYQVQLMEFIDMEHTPKNILIRAVKSPKMKPARKDALKTMDEFWHISPTLEKLLF